MSCQKKKASMITQVVRAMATMALTLCALLAPATALAIDSGDIVVVSVKGEVHVTNSGAPRAVRAGSVLDPPATLRTGRDGAVELRQGATTLSVGPETLLEFPALEKRGAPIDRILQPRGNVFYNIGKREGRKLRIETPYLVGVVKGTQFNVAAQDETTTISLFEGLLEVHAADESGVVDLKAGEIASRQREDTGVSVLKMGGDKAPAILPRQPAGSGSNDGAPKPTPGHGTPRHQDRDSVLVGRSAAAPESGTTAGAPAGPPSTETGVNANVDLGLDPDSDKTRFTVTNGSSSHPVEVTVGSANAADAVSNSGHGNGNDIDNGNGNGNGNGDGNDNGMGSDHGNGNGNGSDHGNGNQGVDVTVDLGVDVGVDDGATTPATDTTDSDKPGHGPPADVVELLDGLVRRRGKK